ncbi:MAG TPA: sigma-70 family RNA polymerase sigma factor [Acidobacteriota bacterium]|nr:sigma-70 family RNA polymerase sigma factor [Acidobacteriota bacterium]
MGTPSPNDLTQLLADCVKGDKSALDRLMPVVYGDLRRLAHRYMRGERPGHTLQTTALINETYLRLVGYRKMQWQDRVHFFAVAAQQMRRILVDSARSRRDAKHGGGVQKLSLDEAVAVSKEKMGEVIAVDDALKELAALDPRKSQIVELRYFGGLDIEEIAEALRISPTTVQRQWRVAKAWLRRAIHETGGPPQRP